MLSAAKYLLLARTATNAKPSKGHGFSRAINASISNRLQPLRYA
jgi:hypothetical protein